MTCHEEAQYLQAQARRHAREHIKKMQMTAVLRKGYCVGAIFNERSLGIDLQRELHDVRFVVRTQIRFRVELLATLPCSLHRWSDWTAVLWFRETQRDIGFIRCCFKDSMLFLTSTSKHETCGKFQHYLFWAALGPKLGLVGVAMQTRCSCSPSFCHGLRRPYATGPRPANAPTPKRQKPSSTMGAYEGKRESLDDIQEPQLRHVVNGEHDRRLKAT